MIGHDFNVTMEVIEKLLITGWIIIIGAFLWTRMISKHLYKWVGIILGAVVATTLFGSIAYSIALVWR